MHFEDWYKKTVTLRWDGDRADLAVAQELFSSHDVDSGSMLLLRSLDLAALPERGRCLDYGCGYGVLGIAIGRRRPAWEIVLVDRDALAVSFSARNAAALGVTAQAIAGLDPRDPSGDGYDLILWNVPGKAGEPVLAQLMADSLDALTPEGVLALVIVHPLAATVRDVAVARADMRITHESRGPEHTILHVQRIAGEATIPEADAFARGAFDREPISVEHSPFAYDLTPVIGLPHYDGPDFTSELLLDAIASRATTGSLPAEGALVSVRPGVGHFAVAMAHSWPERKLTLVDRDVLALRSSARAVLSEVAGASVRTFAAADWSEVDNADARYALAAVRLSDQMRPVVIGRVLEELQARLVPGGWLLVGGGSTEVTRALTLARKRTSLRERDRTKRKGASVALLEKMN